MTRSDLIGRSYAGNAGQADVVATVGTFAASHEKTEPLPAPFF
jgi:hypothetical protein